jgi:hypothetical protein
MTQPQGSIPQGLISRDVLAQMDGIHSSRTSLMPANSGGGDFTYTPNGNSRVIFQIPSYANSYISTRRSYIAMTLTTTGTNASGMTIADGAPVFRRMLLKNGRGQVLEDIDSYDVLCRIKQNMKTKSDIQSRASTSKDNRVMKTDQLTPDVTEYQLGKTVIHNLESGLLSKEQKFLIPVSQMSASAGHCFQLELWLNDANLLFPLNRTANTNSSYKLTDVSYELELVECDASIMQVVNGALANGASIPLPFKSYRAHSSTISSGNKAVVNISDSSHDVSAIFSVLRLQNAGTNVKKPSSTDAPGNILDTRYGTDFDPYSFIGGKNLISLGNVLPVFTHAVERYNYKYGSKLYPLQPVFMPNDSTLALENILSGFELEGKLPYLSESIIVKSNKSIPRFETDCFMLSTNFKTTNDSLANGVNSSANGSPIQLDLMFKGNVSPLECLSFIEHNSVLYISTGGSSSVIKN